MRPRSPHWQRVLTASGLGREGSQANTAKFPNGSFRINHPAPVSGAPKVNAATCFVTFTGSSRFTISWGTRAYKRISGSGKVVISIAGILRHTKSGTCSENGKPVA